MAEQLKKKLKDEEENIDETKKNEEKKDDEKDIETEAETVETKVDDKKDEDTDVENTIVLDSGAVVDENEQPEETEDLVTVMWANEQFDPNRPDTFFEKVSK